MEIPRKHQTWDRFGRWIIAGASVIVTVAGIYSAQLYSADFKARLTQIPCLEKIGTLGYAGLIVKATVPGQADQCATPIEIDFARLLNGLNQQQSSH